MDRAPGHQIQQDALRIGGRDHPLRACHPVRKSLDGLDPDRPDLATGQAGLEGWRSEPIRRASGRSVRRFPPTSSPGARPEEPTGYRVRKSSGPPQIRFRHRSAVQASRCRAGKGGRCRRPRAGSDRRERQVDSGRRRCCRRLEAPTAHDNPSSPPSPSPGPEPPASMTSVAEDAVTAPPLKIRSVSY